MIDWRCPVCGRKLAECRVQGGTVTLVIKCDRCGAMNTKSIEHSADLPTCNKRLMIV